MYFGGCSDFVVRCWAIVSTYPVIALVLLPVLIKGCQNSVWCTLTLLLCAAPNVYDMCVYVISVRDETEMCTFGSAQQSVETKPKCQK